MTNDDFESQDVWYYESDTTQHYLSAHEINRLKIVACFCWYLIYIYDHTQDTIDLTMFRKNQFDEFLICVYQDGMPLMTVNSWRANQMDLVGLFMDQKERDKQELAKKMILSRPSTIVFIDDDNYSVSGNLSESPTDSEFPTYSALVCWRFLGDSAFHKKPSP